MCRQLRLTPQKEGCDEQRLILLKRAWKAVDGGVFAACWSLSESLGFVENEYDQQAEVIHAHAAGFAIGIDLSAGPEPAFLRMALTPRPEADPQALVTAVRRLIEMTSQNIDSLADQQPDLDADMLREILETIRIDTDSNDVLINMRVPLQSLYLLSRL